MEELYQQYINDFNSTINIYHFILNIAIVTLIAFLVKLFYIKFGRAISNRTRFSNNFVPLALATMLIITVIKSSVALSLGLVGALSIVRFRAAIKDPEELTYLFLIIGLGLIGGANKPLLALVSFAIFLPLLYLNNKMEQKKNPISNKASLHIKVSGSSIDHLSQLIAPYTSHLDLKRVDHEGTDINASYQCILSEAAGLDSIIEKIKEKDMNATISYVDQPDLLL